MQLDSAVIEKVEFIHKYLFPLVKRADERISDLEYMRRNDNEFVIIKYRGGTNVAVCISRDNLITLARDVLKYI